mgnify:FL=1
MKISILLPYKENFTTQYPGAVSLFVADTTKCSIFKKSTMIFGSTNYKSFLSKNYTNINLSKKILQSSSKIYVNNFIELQKKQKPDLIEVHNRPRYIKQIIAKLPNKINLYFHNDPLNMNGSQKVKDRIELLKNVNHIIFNSNWSRNRFYVGIDKKLYREKTSTIYQSALKVKIDFNKKQKIISFVGKLNKAKGYDIFCGAITEILDKHPDWKAAIFGDESREQINVSHKNLKIYGFKKHSEVLNFLNKTSISVVCSRWEEPFGRTSLEAASRGAAVILTKKGGLPETTNHGIFLKRLNAKSLCKQLNVLINDDILRKKIQIKTYKDFKFTHKFISKMIDDLRFKVTEKSINTRKDNNLFKYLKILHITNFNERHDGRLHYNTGKRINNGFIRLGHNVLQVSDRDIISNYRNLRDPSGAKTLNKKIINSYNNFKPDLIVLGHADNVSSDTLNYLKNINKDLKICQWFLDPVTKFGPDYENNKRRILDKKKFIDANFLTTDPESLNFEIENSFFIPNPADSSFETLENYKHDCENDLFFAMSHGVHRGILKKGKKDNREKFLKILTKKNENIKYDFYGIQDSQPIWGNNFFEHLSKSKMALNLSRGKPIKYYSSDRLAQLMGNGLLTFIDEKTHYSDFFNKNELVTYSTIDDLAEKVNRYKKNDNQRKLIAKNGKKKYLRYFNSNLVARFIIDKTFQVNKKNKYIWF